MITIIDVMREMRIEPEKRLDWAVGLRMAVMWKRENGEQPPKRNRKKTCGEGVHCFAIYPVSWRERIIAVIADYHVEKSRQLEMSI